MLASLGKIPTTSARRLTSLFNLSNGFVECNFVAVLGRQARVGQHIVFTLVHQGSEFGPAPAQLIGDMAPSLVRGIRVGSQESLADRRGDHGVLDLGDIRQGVSDPMNSTALPARTKHARNGMPQALVGIGDHQLDAFEATLHQTL